MRKFGVAFFCCLISIVVLSQSVVHDKKKVLSELQLVSQKTKTLKAVFKSEKTLSFMTTPQLSSGEFYFSNDGRIRWEQNKPSSYIILVNKGGLRISDNGKEVDVAHAGKVGEQMGNLIVKLVSGDFDDPKMFSNDVLESSNSWVIKLIPVNKRLRDVYENIELIFSKEDLQLDNLTFIEKNGDKNVMTFSNQKINVEIADSLYNKF